MKVAVLIDTWFPFVGGGQINAWEISKRIARSGNQVEILTRNLGKDNLEPVKNLKVIKISKKSTASNQFSKISFIIKSLIYLLKSDYQIIHGHAFLPGITLFIYSRFKKTPTIFTVHGTSIASNLNGYFSTNLEKIILTKLKYTAQITVSRDFLKLKNINNKITYIPNGVDVEKIDKVKTTKYKKPTILFVGRLHPQKNLINLIKAFGLARGKIPNLQLMIVGDGEQKSELIGLTKSLKISKSVVFCGIKSRSELVKIYKSSHVFILPSLYEGQSLALLEAMSNKLPAIVTQVGDNGYLIKNNYNGFIIKSPFTEQNIAEAIGRALKNSDLTNIGIRGRATIKNFSWKKSAQQTLKIYEEV